MLEHYRELDPDVFVVGVFGGNDFSGAMALERYFEHRPPPKMDFTWRKAFQEKLGTQGGILSQELTQAFYFVQNPGDESRIVDVCASITAEMQAVCEELGCGLVFVYIPPPLTAQPHQYERKIERYLRFLEQDAALLEISDRIADGWLAFLDREGIPYADMRPVFRAHEELMYWRANNHLNLAANELVAEALLPLVEGLLE